MALRLKQHRKNLRELSLAELRERLKNSKEELFNLRFQMATGHLSDSSRIRLVKQEIARIHTVIREKELRKEA